MGKSAIQTTNMEFGDGLPVKRERHMWLNEWDIQLCREILYSRPYQHSKGSRESAATWTLITNNMAKIEGFCFATKAIRDHFNGLLSKRRAKVNAERVSTGGGSDDLSELEMLLDEIYEEMEMAKEANDNIRVERRDYEVYEKERTAEARIAPLEPLLETRKRKIDDNE